MDIITSVQMLIFFKHELIKVDVDILIYIEKRKFLTKRVHCKFICFTQYLFRWVSGVRLMCFKQIF